MNKSNKSNRTDIAVTGIEWMGSGIGSVQSAIEELMDSAEREIQIVIYSMTKNTGEFLNNLQSCLARGIHVTMIINRIEKKDKIIHKKLSQIDQKFPHFNLLNFQPENKYEDLHAKILVVDRNKALVGSANLSWSGLIGNHEIALVVPESVASKVAKLIDKLSCSHSITRAGT